MRMAVEEFAMHHVDQGNEQFVRIMECADCK